MFIELLLVAGVFLGTHLGLAVAGLPLAGPIAVAAGVAAARHSLRGTARPWAALGLGPMGSPGRLALATLGCMLAGYAAAVAATLVGTRVLGWPPMDASRFADLPGNVPMLLGLLAVVWTTAAFGEELLFRGFVQGRLQALLGPHRHAATLSALMQALLFGLAHAYQGPTGMLVSGSIGLCFGLLRLRTRTLWPLVLAHGLIDTTSIVAIFALG